MTGPQHTRYLIACRMMQTICSRYSHPCTINVGNWLVWFTFPININISESTLAEWTSILSKYSKISYVLKVENNQFKVEVQ